MATNRNAASIHAIADKLAPTLRKQFLAAVKQLQARMSLEMIMQAIERGGLTIQLEAAIARWPEDLRPAVATVNRVFAAVAEQTEEALQRQLNIGPFTVSNPRAGAAAETHGARLVQGLTVEARKAIASTIAKATQQGGTTRESAKIIRSIAGLNERQASALFNFQKQLIESGQTSSEVARASARYAEKLHRQRALTIARTETIRASSAGREAIWKEAQELGYLDADQQKRWVVTDDDRLCAVCEELDGETVPLEDAFSIGVAEPPAHPNCRCSSVLAIETSARKVA